MAIASLRCDRCQAPVLPETLNTPGLTPCPGCATPLRFLVFPAYHRQLSPAATGESLLIEGESSCFYHPTRKAVVPCDGCGRFLCALCEVELDEKHLCPKCLEAAQQKSELTGIEQKRPLHDLLALNLAIGGLILAFCAPWLSIFLSSAALYLCIRYWNTPQSLLARGKGRFVAAAFLSVAGIGLVALLMMSIFGVMLFA